MWSKNCKKKKKSTFIFRKSIWKKYFLKLGLPWGFFLAFMHFVRQFTHVSRHFRVFSRKQKKLFRENCFENLVSDLTEKLPICPQIY